MKNLFKEFTFMLLLYVLIIIIILHNFSKYIILI